MRKIALALPLLVLALAATALAPAGAAALPLELKLEAEKGADVLTDELTLRAQCDSACTLGLVSIGVLRFDGKGEQLPGAASEPLKGSQKLRPGKAATLKLPLPAAVRSRIQSAVADKGYAVVQVAVSVDGEEGPYTSASLHGPGAPKRLLAQEDIVVDPRPDLPSRPARYRVSISGTQTTTWSYNRDSTTGACKTISNGSGQQTISFRSDAKTVGRVSYGKSGAVLVNAGGKAPLIVPIRIDAKRDGKVAAGLEGACEGVPAGEEGGKGAPADCVHSGGLSQRALLSFSGRDRLNLSLDPEWQLLAPLAGVPDCPIQPFVGADEDLDLLDAVHRMADPGGNDGKVILVARATKTDKLDGGSTTTRVRWVVTFSKLG
jgi:hypothetical protein